MDELIAKLSSTPAQMIEAAKRAEGKPQPDGQWPLRTLAVHMIACDAEIWQPRLWHMATEDNPRWPWTEPDLAEWEKRYATESPEQVFEAFVSRRGDVVNHLRSLTDEDWKRVGTHAVFGVLDVAALCREILKHDEEHLAELLKRGG